MQINDNTLMGPAVLLPLPEPSARSRRHLVPALSSPPRSNLLRAALGVRQSASGEALVWVVLGLSSAAALLLSLWF